MNSILCKKMYDVGPTVHKQECRLVPEFFSCENTTVKFLFLSRNLIISETPYLLPLKTDMCYV